MPLSPAHSGAAGAPGVVLRLEGPGASESEPRMLLKTQGVGKITCESGFKPQCAAARITFNPNPDSHVIFPTPCVFNNILGSLSLAPGPSSRSTTPGAPAAPE